MEFQEGKPEKKIVDPEVIRTLINNRDATRGRPRVLDTALQLIDEGNVDAAVQSLKWESDKLLSSDRDLCEYIFSL